ncbi:MAG: amino acid transporter [Hyphomicrobiales bacterium]|nr:MAG: amino acid transporter [Hyphomicrobiales bacterium]
MAPIETLYAFALATLLFAYMPGPALLYTAAQTISRGRRAGLLAALGIHVGCYVHVLGAVLGLSALFALVPTLYAALKLAGGAYLVWLGIQMFRSKSRPGEPVPELPPRSAKRAFFDSVIVELLNPKVALFFIAFLPQFVDPAAAFPIWMQFLILGMIVNVSFSSADLVTVFFASEVARRLSRSTRWQNGLRKAGGALLIGLGVKLAAERS